MNISVIARVIACNWLILGCSMLPGQMTPSVQPIAVLNEQPIYEKDLLPSIASQLYQLRSQEYELKTAALTNVANQRLLEAEAKRQGVSIEELLQQNVDRNLPPPTAPEIEAYYLGQKERLGKSLEEARPQLEQALMQARRQAARQTWLKGLRDKAGFTSYLNRPKVDVTADPSRLKGSPDAPVTIVEFADFQCPYCQTVQSTLKQIMERYQGRVRIGFRDFPLRQIHPQAQSAAEAARCAAEEGKFWPYHDLLYANQAKLDAASLKDYARTAGLDNAQFDACLDSGKFRPQIESDLQSGAVAGVSGTPAFFINGLLLSGAQPVSAFEAIIDGELKRAESAQAADSR